MPAVLAIAIVHSLIPAEIMCVLTHVRMVIHARAMLNVKLKIIVQFAFAHLILSAIHLQIALLTLWLNQNVRPIQNAHRQHRASIKGAVIHAPNAIHALEMLNVVFHNTVHCAIAHWDGEVIHRHNVINVSVFTYIYFSIISYTRIFTY